VPIRRFLQSRAFDPGVVSLMSEIYVTVCRQLGLKPETDDAMTRRVAAAVIAAIDDGARSREMVLVDVLAKFKQP
jgi:hypothetical protein